MTRLLPRVGSLNLRLSNCVLLSQPTTRQVPKLIPRSLSLHLLGNVELNNDLTIEEFMNSWVGTGYTIGEMRNPLTPSAEYSAI